MARFWPQHPPNPVKLNIYATINIYPTHNTLRQSVAVALEKPMQYQVVLMLWLIHRCFSCLFFCLGRSGVCEVALSPRAGVQDFKDTPDRSLARALGFVNFDTVPVWFSLMSLLRVSKGNLATPAFLGRRLVYQCLCIYSFYPLLVH